MNFGFTHLVVNGCSFTYCQGLDDPLVEGWPKLLADKLKIPLTNLAEPGCGNGRILRTTTDFLYENPLRKPLYIIAFSHSSRREEYYRIINSYKQIQVYKKPINQLTDYEKAYIENFDILEYSKMKARNWVNLINTFKANNIDYLTTDFIPDTTEEIETLQLTHKHMWETIENDVNRIENLSRVTQGLKKLPCGHEDYPTMPIIADYIYKEIEKRWH